MDTDYTEQMKKYLPEAEKFDKDDWERLYLQAFFQYVGILSGMDNQALDSDSDVRENWRKSAYPRLARNSNELLDTIHEAAFYAGFKLEKVPGFPESHSGLRKFLMS